MSAEAVSRQPAGAPVGGQFAATTHTEPAVRLFPLDGLSASTRDAIAQDLNAQRGHLAMHLETLREDAERIETEKANGLRALEDLDQRIADLAVAARTAEPVEGGPTPYQGPEHVDDDVEVAAYGTFHRRREGVYPDQPYSMRIQVGTELTDSQVHHLAQLVGYDWSKTGGERLDRPYQDAPNSIVLYADSTKGRAYRHLDRLEETLADTVEHGSPIRTTDRSGPGTKGTSLVEGLGDLGGVHIYYDSVFTG